LVFITHDLLLFVAVCDIGSASFKYDMRRLLEILALPKAWYRRSLARRMFLGEEPTVPDEESQSGDDIFVYSLLPEGSGFLVKPKFHYADFATKSGTCSRQSRGLVADTNRESLRHKSRR